MYKMFEKYTPTILLSDWNGSILFTSSYYYMGIISKVYSAKNANSVRSGNGLKKRGTPATDLGLKPRQLLFQAFWK